MAPNASPRILNVLNRKIFHLLGFFLVVFSIWQIMSLYSRASGTILESADVLGQMVSEANIDTTVEFTSSATNNNLGSTNQTGFSGPVGTAYDASGNRLFVSDLANNRVLVFDLNLGGGDYYTADYVLGQPDFTSSSSGVTQTTMSQPTGLAYDDSNSRLFVSDHGNNRVLVYDVRAAGSGSQSSCGTSTTGIANGMNASCVFGASDMVGGAPSGMPATTDTPTGLAYDPTTKYLYVASLLQNRVLVFDADTAVLTSNGMDAFHVYGQMDFTGTTAGWDDLVYGSDVPSARSLSSPQDIVLDSAGGLLYIADSVNGRVVVHDVSNVTVGTGGDSAIYAIGKPDLNTFNWLDPLNDPGGPYTETPRQDSLFTPRGVALDTTNGILYVSDSGYHRVTVYDVRSSGSGSQSMCGVSGTGIATGMNASCVFGQSNFTNTSSGTSSLKINAPYYLTYDGANSRMFSADYGNNRIMIFSTLALSNNLEADNNLGQVTLTTTYTYDGTESLTANGTNSTTPVVSASGFEEPNGITIDSAHDRMFISDKKNNRVLVFNLNADDTLIDDTADFVLGQADFNDVAAATTSTGLDYPNGLAYWHAPSDTQYLFVADYNNSRIIAYDVGSISNGEAAVAVIGQTSFTAALAGSPTQTSLVNPSDVTVDSVNNRLYVNDSKNHRILAYDIATLTSTNMAAMAVIGQADYVTGTSGVSTTKVNEPGALFYEASSETLFVSDTRNNRVLTYDASAIVDGSNNVAATHVLGQAVFTSNTASTTQSVMTSPEGLTYNADNGMLFVAADGARVLVFDVASITDGENAIAVIGQLNFTGSITGSTASALSAPIKLFFDTTNDDLYVSDSNNNRVLKFAFVTLSTTSISSSAQVSTAYTAPLTTASSQGTVSYEVVSGTMPTGLSLDATGVVGTPTVAGTYNFVVRAIDTIGSSGFRSNQQSYSIVVAAAPGGGGGGGGGSIPLCTDPLANNFNGQSICEYDPPMISITSPGVTGTYTISSNTIAISGIASDRDTVTSVVYSMNSSVVTPTTGTTAWTTSLLTLIPGSNTFTVTAYNNHGLQAFRTLIINYSVAPQPDCDDDPTLPDCDPVDPPETCATNPSLPGCTTPPTLCLEPAASNFNQPAPCVFPQPTDLCTNISGIQTSIPSGYEVNGGVCTLVPVIDDPGDDDPPIEPPDDGGGDVITPPDIEIPIEDVALPVGIVGIIAGFVAMILGIFGGAIALSEIVFIPARIWQLILGFLGFKKRVRHWGIVFDSITKQPLDPAYVSLFDADGKEVATAITDLEGRYGFLVQPGQYRIEAHKTNYLFPSRKMAGKRSDEIYRDLYFGDYFEVKTDGEVIMKNIPLDPEHFDWNEYIKNERHLVKSHAGRARFMAALSNVLFYGGFIASTYAFYLDRSTFNLVLVCIYVALFILRLIIKKPSYGAVINSGEPIPFGVVKIYSKKLGTLLSTKVLDKYGRYYALAPKGTYYAIVEKKNDDQSYQALHTTNSFENNKGVINRKFKI